LKWMAPAAACGLTAKGIGVEFSTSAPVSLYGATKLASEIMALEYAPHLISGMDYSLWSARWAGQFGTPAQASSHFGLTRICAQAMRYIGFEGRLSNARRISSSGSRGTAGCSNAHSADDGRRIYTAGGGPSNSMSLAQLTAWCDERFGCHAPTSDKEPRKFDIPWVVMDNAWQKPSSAGRLRCLLAQFSKGSRNTPTIIRLAGSESRMKSPAPLRGARFNCFLS